ncbi:glycosyltransferase family 4 protein [Alteromonas sp. H39]|uniref:glycosyltransferase family 4 protein n=1 Tax=Alteromonas sp. H39 TaxID=3389876 RepID=UPI0039E124B1
MTKALVLTENFPPIDGGSGRWFWELYSRLSRGDYLIMAHTEDGAEEFDRTHDLNVIRYPLRNPEWGLKSLSGLKFYWRSLMALKKQVKAHDVKIVHCGRVIHEGVTAWLLNLLTGTPYLCYVHGEDVETAATSREQAMLVKQVCKRASVLVCNSENSKNLVTSLGFAEDSKCVVLHPGVDESRFSVAPPDNEFRRQMGWENKHVLLTVGRLQQRKGQDMMIQAMPDILKQYPNIHYVVVGRGDSERMLRDLVASHELGQHVDIITDADDDMLIKLYQQCDTFILPNRTIGSDIEGFGMVLVEAQACGKPVIAGDSGGTRETMKLHETGCIIDCSTPESVANGVCESLTEIARFTLPPAKFVDTNFTWRKHVEKARRLFASLTN